MTIWQAWFKALKAYRKNPARFTGRPRMPRYLHKSQRHTFYVTNQNAQIVRKDEQDKGYLVIKKLGIKIKLASADIKKIGRVAFKPVANGYKVIVPYKTKQKIKYLPDNGKIILGIDLALIMLFACVSNTGALRPLLINGRGIKSVNSTYNKSVSELKATAS